MTTYGVTATGFVMPALDDLIAAREATYRSTFGSSLNVAIPAEVAEIIGIEAEREFLQWQGQEAVYNSQFPNTAQGQSLDYVASLTGTVRSQATGGTVLLDLYVAASSTVASGRLISDGTANAPQWLTTAAAVNSSGSAAWVTGVSATCQTKGAIQEVAGALTTAVNTDPNWINAPVTTYATQAALLAATPAAGTIGKATDTGAYFWYTGSAWLSTTNTAAFNVINPADATLGQATQTDTELLASRVAELAASGGSTIDAIRAHILQITDPTTGSNAILACEVFENITDSTDVNGNLPHSIHALVQRVDGWSGAPDAIDQLIANQVWGKAAGIATNGSVSNTVTDAAGNTHTVLFDRPTLVPIYMAITMTMGTASAAAIKAALALYGDGFVLGQDVIANQFFGPLYAASGGGEVTALNIGLSASPVSNADIPIAAYSLATFSTTNILINGA